MRRGLRLIACVLLFALGGGCAPPPNQFPSTVSPAPPAPTASPEPSSTLETPAAEAAPERMKCLYYERTLFLSAMSQPRPYEAPAPGGRLAAGMVPHHLLAADMIAGFFSLAAAEPAGYDTVLILSPSHYPESCGSDIVTATRGWETPYGPVEADTAIPAALLRNRALAVEDNARAVEADHGAAGLVPFVRYYLPNAKVAVCLLANKLDRERLSALWAAMAALCADSRVLLVASADCSHYLSPEDASVRDSETMRAIEAFDYSRILGFDDRNMDSPQTVTAFLKAVQAQSAVLQRLDHASSAEKLPQSPDNPLFDEGVTTYLVYAAWSGAVPAQAAPAQDASAQDAEEGGDSRLSGSPKPPTEQGLQD